MPNYMAPGVYVEEISTGARPIQAVGTSTAGFVGAAPNRQALLHEPTEVTNWSQFLSLYSSPGAASTHLSNAVFGFFNNGGTRCYVVNIGDATSIAGDGPKRSGLKALEPIDEIAIVAAPGFSDPASHEALLSHCEGLKDRVAICDPPRDVTDIDTLKNVGTVPVASSARPRRAAGAAGDAMSAETGGGETGEKAGVRPRQSDGGYGAFYFPWIYVRDPLSPSSDPVAVPPSGHMAGVWARVDATRGVHKAPANEAIRGALNLTYRVTRQQQEGLNQVGVNCIRFFSSEGIRIWGARTVASGSSEWRYLSVRRLFNMIEESIANSTRWVVFEPNDRPLWKSIRRDVTAFLTLLWRDGALMGATPEEAFFVQCDEETNPPEVVDAGMVVTVIGIAPVKPAEFVIFRIGQHQAGTQID